MLYPLFECLKYEQGSALIGLNNFQVLTPLRVRDSLVKLDSLYILCTREKTNSLRSCVNNYNYLWSHLVKTIQIMTFNMVLKIVMVLQHIVNLYL